MKQTGPRWPIPGINADREALMQTPHTQTSSPVTMIDWADFITTPPPVEWLVDGILPVGVAGDLFGPPNAGKSSLIYSLAAAIADGSGNWFGRKVPQGPVVIIGGEYSSRDALWRSAHRFVDSRLPKGQLITINHTPLVKWHRGYSNDHTQEGWYYVKPSHSARHEGHPGGEAVIAAIVSLKPVLVICDTTMAVAEGCNQMDNAQQYALSEFFQRRVVRDLSSDGGHCTVITVSHTNQSSSSESLPQRLHYQARAGGNGAPGAFRWMAGITGIRSEGDCVAVGNTITLNNLERSRYFAFGVSKHNEVNPDWTDTTPAIFEQTRDGKILLAATGEEVRKAQKAYAEQMTREGSRQRTAGTQQKYHKPSGQNSYATAKAGDDGTKSWMQD